MPRPHRLRTLVICSAISIFLTHVSPAQTSSKLSQSAPSLLVAVTDENDVAVASALVFLQASPEAVALRCVTDFAGHCEFSNLSAASYQLRVEKQGFYSITLMLPAIQTGAAPNVEITNIEVTLPHQRIRSSLPASTLSTCLTLTRATTATR
ncbi:MAG: carboxypeptidase-like regulatory domain-containing protein [Terriglobales bacterium]